MFLFLILKDVSVTIISCCYAGGEYTVIGGTIDRKLQSNELPLFKFRFKLRVSDFLSVLFNYSTFGKFACTGVQ